MKGTVTIRSQSVHGWRDRHEPTHDPRIADIENWPHPFNEHPDRWTATGTEHPDFGGCRTCGASELSAIHWQGAT